MADNTDLETKIEELERANQELQTKNTELENNWKRALADYRNFRNRVSEEKDSYYNFATSQVISGLLPILDNLETLEKHIDDLGLKLITKEFKQVLESEGLTEVPVINEEFNPQLMDAIEMIEGEKNKVVEVLNKGYFLKGKLLRPARVKVGNGETSTDDKNNGQGSQLKEE